MTWSSRIGAGLTAALVAGAVTAAVESIFEAAAEGPGPTAITFVVLFAVYGFVALCSVVFANLVWLVGRRLLKQLELLLLPLITSMVAWQTFTGTRWDLLSSRAISLCTTLLFVGYSFGLYRLRGPSVTH